jgi:Na+-driven multidrug efflux pump
MTFRYEVWATVSLAVSASVMALLIGFGFTKLTLFLNVCRIFIFRIPVLWFLQNHTDVGAAAAGLVMLISNLLVGVLSIFMAMYVIRKISAEYDVPFISEPKGKRSERCEKSESQHLVAENREVH